jgi:ABC-type branched-subunit amino acid transport system substrate-binding protein
MNKSLFILIIISVLFTKDIYALQKNSKNVDTIKIGLLIEDTKSFEARNGAELAISMANKKQGPDELNFNLEVRSMEGSWGTGSKEVVNLVFKDKVWAILGSHDGRNAHLVEQVIAKTQIVFLSAWASDPTLSQAFVPWYFNCVPNDIQQADVLIQEIYGNRKIAKIAIVSDRDYDSKMALESFLKRWKIIGKADPIQLLYKNPDKDLNTLIDKLIKADVNGVLLFGQPAASLKFINQLRQKSMDQPVFGTLALLGKTKMLESEFANFKGITFVTSVNWLGPNGIDFKKSFQRKYGKDPSEIAAYAFDGMNLIIEAIRSSGYDRDKVQEAMSKSDYKGVTGSIQFDKRGNRKDNPVLKD